MIITIYSFLTGMDRNASINSYCSKLLCIVWPKNHRACNENFVIHNMWKKVPLIARFNDQFLGLTENLNRKATLIYKRRKCAHVNPQIRVSLVRIFAIHSLLHCILFEYINKTIVDFHRQKISKIILNHVGKCYFFWLLSANQETIRPWEFGKLPIRDIPK